jgi:tyrosyl-tRNA synthetase
VRGLEPEAIEDALVAGEDGVVHVPALIQREFQISRSEARRLIDQGGVALGDRTLAPGEHDVPISGADGQVLRVGKRRFRRLRAG